MLSIRWEWRPLTDTETNLIFLVSPFFGTLHTLPIKQRFLYKLPTSFLMLGCFNGNRNPLGWDIDVIEPPARSTTWYHSDPRHSEWENQVKEMLNFRPLILAINKLENDARRRTQGNPSCPREIDHIISEVLSAWRFCRLPECLPRALFRYTCLRQHDVRPHIVIGVHLPTDRMHAWVELDGQVLGEEPDEMLCYRGAVRYYSNS